MDNSQSFTLLKTNLFLIVMFMAFDKEDPEDKVYIKYMLGALGLYGFYSMVYDTSSFKGIASKTECEKFLGIRQVTPEKWSDNDRNQVIIILASIVDTKTGKTLQGLNNQQLLDLINKVCPPPLVFDTSRGGELTGLRQVPADQWIDTHRNMAIQLVSHISKIPGGYLQGYSNQEILNTIERILPPISIDRSRCPELEPYRKKNYTWSDSERNEVISLVSAITKIPGEYLQGYTNILLLDKINEICEPLEYELEFMYRLKGIRQVPADKWSDNDRNGVIQTLALITYNNGVIYQGWSNQELLNEINRIDPNPPPVDTTNGVFFDALRQTPVWSDSERNGAIILINKYLEIPGGYLSSLTNDALRQIINTNYPNITYDFTNISEVDYLRIKNPSEWTDSERNIFITTLSEVTKIPVITLQGWTNLDLFYKMNEISPGGYNNPLCEEIRDLLTNNPNEWSLEDRIKMIETLEAILFRGGLGNMPNEDLQKLGNEIC